MTSNDDKNNLSSNIQFKTTSGATNLNQPTTSYTSYSTSTYNRSANSSATNLATNSNTNIGTSGYSSYYSTSAAMNGSTKPNGTTTTSTQPSNTSTGFVFTKQQNDEINLSSASFVHDEKLAYDVLEKAGPSSTYQRKECLHDIASLADPDNYTSNSQIYQETNELHYSTSANTTINETTTRTDNLTSQSTSSIINQDPTPIRILKPNNQNLVYKQQVNIRYLQPPTPPPPAPIIIREKQMPAPPPQPPIIIRQTAPAPPTPPPLIIREKAPTPPPMIEPTIIERPIPAPPPPPRQVIIERIPAPPPKPRPIIYEKWLPYKPVKRPVIIQKFKPIVVQTAPKNIIIEYERPKAVSVRHVIEEGIFRVDPNTYQSAVTDGELRIVDRITDLPIQNSRILSQLHLNSEFKYENIEQFNCINTTDIQTSTYLSSKSFNKSMPNLADNTYYQHQAATNDFQAYTTTTSYPGGADYETITTTVPQSLAEKIIAEAQAAGATISRSSSIVRTASLPRF